MDKKIKDKKEDWVLAKITKAKIDETISKMAHFTFKMTNSNSLPGGLVAEKLNLDGYVSMSTTMSGNEYEIMQNPSSSVKIFKRIMAVVYGNESELFEGISVGDVEYIKLKMESFKDSKNSMGLDIPNKRLKNVIIQSKNKDVIENKEVIILRSTGFAKIVNSELIKERNLRFQTKDSDDVFYSRKTAKMSFGGSNKINVGVNSYLITPLYFDAPSSKNTDLKYKNAYFLHKNGINIYNLITEDFLNIYNNYLNQAEKKFRKNLYFRNREENIIFGLLNDIKIEVSKGLKLLVEAQDSLPSCSMFNENLGKEKKIIFALADKNFIQSNEDEEFLITMLITAFKNKTFYDKQTKTKSNLFLDSDDIIRIKNLIKEFV